MLECLLLQERERASAWCERELVMPRAASPHPGVLSFERQPFLREILDCVLDPGVETVVVSGGAQIGKTTLLMCMLAAVMGLEPVNVLWSMKSIDQMKVFSRDRLMEFIRANPVLSRHVRPGDAAAFQPFAYALDHMSVRLVGAGSPANLASVSVGAVIADECAKYEWLNRDEAPPLLLLQERTKAYPRRFHVFCSTPTTVENDFWQLFVAGEMRQFFVPCPYCGLMQVLHWSERRIRYDRPADDVVDLDLAARSTRYVCEGCGAEIWEDQKSSMLAAGEWRVSDWLRRTYGDEKRVPSRRARSYQISSMYSPFLSWGDFTREYLKACGQLFKGAALQNVQNSWAALPWEDYQAQVKEDDVLALCGDYQRGVVPDGYHYISVGYDPGGDRTHWVAVAVCAGGELRVIDWGTILQFRTISHVAADGRTVVDSPGIAPHFRSLRWGDHVPGVGWVDSGYMTEDIYDECALLPGVLNPTKGSSARQGTWFARPAKGRWAHLEVVTYVDHHAKMSLYAETIQRRRAPVLVLPRVRDVDDELRRGLSGQRLVMRHNRLEWRRVDGDHYGDCVKLSRVGWWVLGRRFEDSGVIVDENAAPGGEE